MSKTNKIKSYRRLPLYIVEDHNEVILHFNIVMKTWGGGIRDDMPHRYCFLRLRTQTLLINDK